MKGLFNKLLTWGRSVIPQDTINNFYHLPKAILAVAWFGYPAKGIKVIAVTGTSGKTSTTALIYHILKSAGLKAGMISTVKAVIGGKEYDTGFHVTNPDAITMQRLLKEAKEAGDEYLVLEMSSHGLSQFRNLGTNVFLAVITNITHEHLDYHKNMRNYVLAKARIMQGAKYSILNRDDRNFRTLLNNSSGRVITFGMKKTADYTPKTFLFHSKTPGIYNKYNCLAAIAAAKTLGIEENLIRKAIFSFKGIPGRMEEIRNSKKFRIFIDFAHKPDALENILQTAGKMVKKGGRVICMFGCAGLRDKSKRPIMGSISGRLADITVITAEDPRTENLGRICKQIAKGAQKSNALEVLPRNIFQMRKNANTHLYLIIPERQKAINTVINKIAKKNDLVLFCGKGHERSMCFGMTEYPWNEKEEILKALNK